jgi:glycine cleavage system H protein
VRVDGDTGVVVSATTRRPSSATSSLDLPAAGASLTKLGKMGEIESVKAVSELYSPVSGEVLEVNNEAIDSPELVNSDPYGRGWLIKIRLSETSEVEELLDAAAYDEFVTKTMEEETD